MDLYKSTLYLLSFFAGVNGTGMTVVQKHLKES